MSHAAPWHCFWQRQRLLTEPMFLCHSVRVFAGSLMQGLVWTMSYQRAKNSSLDGYVLDEWVQELESKMKMILPMCVKMETGQPVHSWSLELDVLQTWMSSARCDMTLPELVGSDWDIYCWVTENYCVVPTFVVWKLLTLMVYWLFILCYEIDN